MENFKLANSFEYLTLKFSPQGRHMMVMVDDDDDWWICYSTFN